MNASIEFYELLNIHSTLISFQNMISSQIITLRDGSTACVEAKDIVPGDIIHVKSGDKVPADCIVFWTNELRIDGSHLTGENEPFVRLPCLQGEREGRDPFECSHVIFSSDVVASGMLFNTEHLGEGYAIVVQTGDNSITGKIRKLSAGSKPRASILTREINRFCKSIGILACLTSLIFFVWALARGRSFTYAVTFGVGIMIAWLPQGLPFTVTMLLSLSSRRMTDRQVLVKDFKGIETLGAVTMLATDKTGTITKNSMTVSDVWLNESFWAVDENSMTTGNEKILKMDVSGIAQLLHVCITCSR